MFWSNSNPSQIKRSVLSFQKGLSSIIFVSDKNKPSVIIRKMGAIYGEAYYRQNLVYTCAKHIVFQQDNPLRVQKTNYLINKTFRAQQSSKEFDVDSHLGPKKVIYICQYICIYQYIYITYMLLLFHCYFTFWQRWRCCYYGLHGL